MSKFSLTKEQYSKLVAEAGLKRLGDLLPDGNRSSRNYEDYFNQIYDGMELLGYTGVVMKVIKWEGSGIGFVGKTLSENGMVNISDDDTILIACSEYTRPYHLPFKKGEGLAILS